MLLRRPGTIDSKSSAGFFNDISCLRHTYNINSGNTFWQEYFYTLRKIMPIRLILLIVFGQFSPLTSGEGKGVRSLFSVIRHHFTKIQEFFRVKAGFRIIDLPRAYLKFQFRCIDMIDCGQKREFLFVIIRLVVGRIPLAYKKILTGRKSCKLRRSGIMVENINRKKIL
jgi:hypothetical protein